MSNLSLGSSDGWEEDVGAAGNNTSPSLYVAASSAALCWRRRVRRLTVNSTWNFIPSTKRSSNLQTNSHNMIWIADTKNDHLCRQKMSLCCLDLTLSWSPVWCCPAAHCGRSRGTSPLSLLRDTQAADRLLAQTDGSQTHQVPDRWTRSTSVTIQVNISAVLI